MNAPTKFSFADHAQTFDDHIGKSIPSFGMLGDQCVMYSKRFIQDASKVIDVGCSTGRLLRAVSRYNRKAHKLVKYVGLDNEPKFGNEWGRFRNSHLDFRLADVRSYDHFENTSLAFSMFTVQFLPEADKLPLLHRMYEALLPGGALIIAEKILASSARLQDALTFPFYDRKLRYFSAEDLLDKERKLRGQMTLWSEEELKSKLGTVGFREIQCFWTGFPFTSMIAVKGV